MEDPSRSQTDAPPHDASFEDFFAEVAARIIQSYWRKSLARRAHRPQVPLQAPRTSPPMQYHSSGHSKLDPFESGIFPVVTAVLC